VTDKGSVIKYKSYEAREIDVKEGRIKRITAHEAREIEADGARPSPWSSLLSGHPRLEARNLNRLLPLRNLLPCTRYGQR
jgi:hypothetical protein